MLANDIPSLLAVTCITMLILCIANPLVVIGLVDSTKNRDFYWRLRWWALAIVALNVVIIGGASFIYHVWWVDYFRDHAK